MIAACAQTFFLTMAALDLSMLQAAQPKRSALVASDEVDFQNEHPTTFSLAPVRDVRSLCVSSIVSLAVLPAYQYSSPTNRER